jgi:uncharacterized protein
VGTRKHCTVVYALPDRQYLWHVELDEQGTVQDALERARRLTEAQNPGTPIPAIPWAEADVGIFGEIASRDAVPSDGDRIEIYRPLVQDPKQARRERARVKRRAR